MNKTLSAMAFAAAAALATPAFADAAIPQRVQFDHEGVTYTYTKTKVGESTIYKGYATPGHSFYLVARKGVVTGKSNGINVSFRTGTAVVQSAGAEMLPLAAR